MIEVLEKLDKEIKHEKSEKVLISLIFIVYNQAREVENIYLELRNTFDKNYAGKYEMIFVDDGSEDETAETLRKINAEDSSLKIVKMRSHFGEASALEAGLNLSSGEIIVYSASRVRIDPRGLLALTESAIHKADFVVGWRFPRGDWKLNQLISKIFNGIVSWLTGLKLHDINSGVFAAKREVLESLDLYGDLNNFIPILVHKLGYKIREEKITQKKGHFRKSKYITEYFQRALDILTVIFLTKYSKKPLHFLGLFGILFTISGLAIDTYLFIYRILGMGPIAGRPLLLLGVLLFILGIQMISIGLIGEMIIFTHASGMEEYNIENIYE